MSTEKKTYSVRGSATYYEDGSYTFNPYNENPTENSPWRLLADCPEGKLTMTRNVVKMEIKVKPEELSAVTSKINRTAGYLLGKLLTHTTAQKYERVRGERRK